MSAANGISRPAGSPTAPVSVIVPAYGHADYIGTAIESVLRQPTPPREVIVIDDSSPDDTAARLAPLVQAQRIRYFRQPNAGMAAARNAGAKLATSEYLYFLDDDDVMFPNALLWLVREIERHPDAALVFGDCTSFVGEPPAVPERAPESWPEAQDVDRVRFAICNQVVSPGQVLVRRSAFEAVDGFDTGIWGADDWDLWLRILEQFPARWASHPIIAYRLHSNNASRNFARMYEASVRVSRHHLRAFPEPDRTIIRRSTYRRLRQFYAREIGSMIVRAARRGDHKIARQAARTWIRVWSAEASALGALKVHLLRHGRWRLERKGPLFEAIVDQG